MNTVNTETERIDLLVSHAVDGEATAQEWREFESLAHSQPRLWRELAEAQRDAAALRSAIGAAAAVADGVALPREAPPDLHVFARSFDAQRPLRLNRFGAWTGWAVAALVTIIASLQISALQRQGGGERIGTHTTGLDQRVNSTVQSAADLWDAYVNRGKADGTVIGEMPGRMLVESRPAPQGQGYEVIFIRQIVERAVVPDLYRVEGLDEGGQPTFTPVRRGGGGLGTM